MATVLAYAEEFLLASPLLPDLYVLSAVLPVVVVGVACAVAGTTYLRVALASVLSTEIGSLLSLVYVPLQTLTLAASSPKPAAVPQAALAAPQPKDSLKSHALDLQSTELILSDGRSRIYFSLLPREPAFQFPLLGSLVTGTIATVGGGARMVADALRLSPPCSPRGSLLLPDKASGDEVAGPVSFAISDLSEDDDDELSENYCLTQAMPLVMPSPLAFRNVPADCSAVACLGADNGCTDRIRALLPDTYLLQFGAMAGEQACIEELRCRQLAWAWGTGDTLFGQPDTPRTDSDAWEPIVTESSPTAAYTAWRKPLRKGYYMYKSVTIIEGLTAAELKSFNLHSRTRWLWDDTAMVLENLLEHEQPADSLCKLQQYRCRYPAPMAPREYVYARRVWDTTDGGCYVVSRGLDMPATQLAVSGGRTCRVSDYVSCMRIRAVPSTATGAPGGACEVVTIYYEDPSMNPGVTALAIRKGLWQFVLRHEAAFRDYSLARRAAGQAAQRHHNVADSADAGAADSYALRVESAAMDDDVLAAQLQSRRSIRRGARGGLSRRMLRPIASLPTHGLLRQRLVLLVVMKLVHGAVGARD